MAFDSTVSVINVLQVVKLLKATFWVSPQEIESDSEFKEQEVNPNAIAIKRTFFFIFKCI
jgi:hypothetical protein